MDSRTTRRGRLLVGVIAIFGAVFLALLALPDWGSLRPSLAPIPEPDLTDVPDHLRARIVECRRSLGTDVHSPALRARVAELHGRLGRLYVAACLPAAAEPCLANAVSFAPDDLRWVAARARALTMLDRTEEALASLAQARRRQPEDRSLERWVEALESGSPPPDDDPLLALSARELGIEDLPCTPAIRP